MIFCARATRGLRRMERIAWPSSCSRNAHNHNVLVRRAQSRINQAILESEMGKGEDARSGRSISPHPLKSKRASLETDGSFQYPARGLHGPLLK